MKQYTTKPATNYCHGCVFMPDRKDCTTPRVIECLKGKIWVEIKGEAKEYDAKE